MKKKQKLGGLLLLGAAAVLLTGCTKEDSGAYDRALAAFSQADYSTAMEEFQNAADTDGREAEAYRGEGMIYLKRGDYKHAITLFDLSLEHMEHKNQEFREDVLLYKAEACAKNGRQSDAKEIYNELLKGDRSAEASLMLGQLSLQEGDSGQAKAYFDEAMKADSIYSQALAIYEAYAAVSMEGDGADYLEQALDVEPESTEDQYLYGMICYRLEDSEQASIYLTKAANAGSAEALMELGQMYLDQGDVGNARDLFQNSLNNDLCPAAARNGLAECELAEQDPEGALEEIREGLALEDAQQNIYLLYNEVVAYEQLQQYDLALERAESFLETYPDHEAMQREYLFLSSRLG